MKKNFSDLFATAVTLWVTRLAALFDGSAWLMFAPAFVWLYFKDQPLVSSVLQWSVFFFLLSAVAVVISRIAFPQLHLGAFIAKALKGSVAAAIVVAAVIVFVAWTISSIAIWARPIGG